MKKLFLTIILSVLILTINCSEEEKSGKSKVEQKTYSSQEITEIFPAAYENLFGRKWDNKEFEEALERKSYLKTYLIINTYCAENKNQINTAISKLAFYFKEGIKVAQELTENDKYAEFIRQIYQKKDYSGDEKDLIDFKDKLEFIMAIITRSKLEVTFFEAFVEMGQKLQKNEREFDKDSSEWIKVYTRFLKRHIISAIQETSYKFIEQQNVLKQVERMGLQLLQIEDAENKKKKQKSDL